MAKICFQMIVFNGDAFLEPALESILPYGPVIVTEGPVEYFARQGYSTSTDWTNVILHDMVGAENVVHGQWHEKDEMMNAAVHLIPYDTTHVWMVDADEIYPPELIERVLGSLDQFDNVEFKPFTFFGGFERYLTGFERLATWRRVQRWHPGARWQTHRPPTVLAPDGKPYAEHNSLRLFSNEFFHYSYVMPSQVQAKVAYYESWGAGVIPNWFERVYLPWVLEPESRWEIEAQFSGVHEWLPARRGDCFTAAFEGEHPKVIADRLPQLRARFERELAEVRITA